MTRAERATLAGPSRTISLDGDGWSIRPHLGAAAALAAAERAGAGPPQAIHAEHVVAAEAVPAGSIPAHVPGSVLDDLVRAGDVPDPYVERNSLACEWVAARAWTYRRSIDVPALRRDERAWLRFGGIDAAGHVVLDGRIVASHEGMFVPLEVEVTAAVHDGGRHDLAVVLEPAPASEPQVGRTSAVGVHKARMTYGWDFCPRLVHQGLWQPVELVIAGPARIADVWARPRLSEDRATGTVRVHVELDRAGGFDAALRVAAAIGGEETEVVVEPGVPAVADLELRVERPAPWWPNGVGPGSAVLHELSVRVSTGGAGEVVDERTLRIGFRRVERRPNPGSPADARPWSFVVNGEPMEIKGWNWAPLDALYGVPRPARLDHLLRLAAASGANLIRVWGGGLIESEAFYDGCDRLGLLVWQEFSQSSSGLDDEPSRDPSFVDRMRRESEVIVPLRRSHPSLAIWGGGNELQGQSGPLEDEDSPVLGALHDVVARMDPDRIWLPTSPTGPRFGNTFANLEAAPDELHEVHGPWEHQGLRGQAELWDRGTSLMNGEFGVEGMTTRRSHERLIRPEHRWPADRSNPVYRHLGDWWNNAELVQSTFGGRLGDLETMRRASQHLQADGLRYAIEANRRRWPRNSGSIPWQLHESYPNAWCTSVLAYGGDPKPAFFAVARAWRAAIVCARIPGWALDGAAELAVEPWAWAADRDGGGAVLRTRLLTPGGEVLGEHVGPVDLRGRQPVSTGAPVVFELRAGDDPVVILDLWLTEPAAVGGAPIATNRYVLGRGHDLGPLLDLAPASVEVDVSRDAGRWCLRVRHVAGPAAIGLGLTDPRSADEGGWAEPNDGWLDLLPGETAELTVGWSGVDAADRRLRLDAWNVAPMELR